MQPFSGLSAFPVTPADEHGIVDCDQLGQLIERLRLDGVSSIGVLGSTGCYMYLSAEQRDRALHAAIEAAGDTPVVAGIGALRTSDVLTHIKSAEKAGARGLLLAPASYLPLTDDDVTALFKDAHTATELPLCFYNNPGTTHFSLSEDLLAKLAGDNLIASVKNPPPGDGDFGAQMTRLRAAVPETFSLGYSGDAAIAGALAAGADAWYSVLAGTLPDIAIDLWNARHDAQQLADQNARLVPLWSLFDQYGSIRVIHEIVGMIGLPSVQLPRPLLPLQNTAIEETERVLDLIGQLERTAA